MHHQCASGIGDRYLGLRRRQGLAGPPLSLGWPLARFEHQQSLFDGCKPLGGGGVGGFEANHAGEVAASKGFDAAQYFGLHIAHCFNGSLLGGGHGGGHGGGDSLLGRFNPSSDPLFVFVCHRGSLGIISLPDMVMSASDTVWNVVTRDLPLLEKAMRAILAELEQPH